MSEGEAHSGIASVDDEILDRLGNAPSSGPESDQSDEASYVDQKTA